MTEAVVHGLEAIEIEEQHADLPRLARIATHRVRDAIAEQRAIREPREWIVECLPRELRLELLSLRDVLHDPDESPTSMLGIDARDRCASPDDLSVFPNEPLLERRTVA